MSLPAGGNLIPLQISLHLAEAEQTVHKTLGRNEAACLSQIKVLLVRASVEKQSQIRSPRRRARFSDVRKSN